MGPYRYTNLKNDDNIENNIKMIISKIPYKNPFTGKHTIYVPDFLIHYIDAKGKTHTEVIEIKPRNQTIKEQAKSRRNQAHWALNQAKWAVAQHWCKQKGMIFRIINEQDIFHNVK